MIRRRRTAARSTDAQPEPRASADTLIAFPHYPNNPYQSIVYAALPAETTLITPVDVAALTTALRECDAHATVLHLNWTAPIAQTAPTAAEAESAVDAFLASLDEFRSRGGALIWTVHNVLPHELRHREAELRLSRAIAARADAVETMNPATAELVAGDNPLPAERTVVHAHPSYLGRFRDDITRDQARRAFALTPDARVLLLFGTLRPYKGVTEVVEAFRQARQIDPRLVLLVAGEIGAGFSREQLEALLGHDGIISSLDYVPAEDTQLCMRAADAVVLPYRSALNPSLVYLAATFGTPVLLSALPSLRYLLDESWVHPIDVTKAADLPSALLAGLDDIETSGASPGEAAREFARRADPGVVADRFAAFVAAVRQNASRSA